MRPLPLWKRHCFNWFFFAHQQALNKPATSTELSTIDSIAQKAIATGATPGCVVLALKDGKIVYHKAFGYTDTKQDEKATIETVYDVASVTKICATTIALMKLYEQGKIDLHKTVADYLPQSVGSNKANIRLSDLLLHQAGLIPFFTFYKQVCDSAGQPLPDLFRAQPTDSFSTRVTANLYLRNDWQDTILAKVLQSQLVTPGKYVYSDNDFILLGKIVEAVAKQPLNQYVQQQFYRPMLLNQIGYWPWQILQSASIAPTEQEKTFRNQLIRAEVHDPGAAMMGGVAGHAGLFSNAYSLAAIMQMLLNEGAFNGNRYLSPATVQLFTQYHSKVSRRGYGFDKPEQNSHANTAPYPCKSASALSFGHSGFTGTFVWADPAKKLVYVFLSNRINPDAANNLLQKTNVRTEILQVLYDSLPE